MQAYKGLEEKFNKNLIDIQKNQIKDEIFNEYKQRLNHEIKIISSNKFNVNMDFLVSLKNTEGVTDILMRRRLISSAFPIKNSSNKRPRKFLKLLTKKKKLLK